MFSKGEIAADDEAEVTEAGEDDPTADAGGLTDDSIVVGMMLSFLDRRSEVMVIFELL